MKVKAYLRIGKSKTGKYKVAATSKPNYAPLTSGQGRLERVVPTVMFAVDFNISDALFKQAETVVAEINVDRKKAVIAAHVEAP